MAKSQIEVNYENALKAKDEAAKRVSDLQGLIADQEAIVSQKLNNYNAYGRVVIGGKTFYYDPEKRTETELTTTATGWPFGGVSGFYSKNWEPTSEHKKGEELLKAYNDAKSRLDALKSDLASAKQAYNNATVTANEAYNDWLEWKKSNMTPEELQSLVDVEDKAKTDALRRDVIKWGLIGVGSIGAFFLIWWIVKRMRG